MQYQLYEAIYVGDKESLSGQVAAVYYLDEFRVNARFDNMFLGTLYSLLWSEFPVSDFDLQGERNVEPDPVVENPGLAYDALVSAELNALER